jgi:hypothetical protein
MLFNDDLRVVSRLHSSWRIHHQVTIMKQSIYYEDTSITRQSNHRNTTKPVQRRFRTTRKKISPKNAIKRLLLPTVQHRKNSVRQCNVKAQCNRQAVKVAKKEKHIVAVTISGYRSVSLQYTFKIRVLTLDKMVRILF